jgi:hypothetical protein
MRIWLTAIAIAVLALVVPRLALAQTVTLQQTGISRVNSDGSAVTTKSTTNMNVFARVNGADCYGTDDKGIDYVFPITVQMGNSGLHVEVWAGGSDCSPLTSRTGTTAVCWPVLQAMLPAYSTVQNVQIRAQDIVSNIAATTKPLTYTAAGSSACTVTTTMATVTVYFLLLDGTSNPVGTSAAWPMKIKLVGPPAPDPITADGLDNAVRVGWTAVNDPDEVGYRVFVDQGSGTDASTNMTDAQGTLVTTCADGGVDEAGNAADGGCTTTTVYDNEAGGGTAGSCGSGKLVGGGRADQLVSAAQAGKVDTSTTVSNVSNGSSYAVAVATVDSYDNVGPLSNPACVTPAPVLDFWTKYKGDGGGAGGFCALEGENPTGGVMGLGLVFAAIAWARRKRGGAS